MVKFFNKDTIVGPATSFGHGGIGIIRTSGGESLSFFRRFFRLHQGLINKPVSHRLYYGSFVDTEDRVIDEVMAVYMQGPNSYTREDVLEIHCHGGVAVGKMILEVFRLAGARLSDPGEFTLRAFLNGRIDLTQAEGVMEIIEAQNTLSHKVAVQHLEGSLGEFCQDLREKISDALALLETWIDFPEDDIDHPSRLYISEILHESISRLAAVVKTFHAGKVLRHGVSVLILGKPNVGKSSLLNALIGTSRAIVTDLPGTTRDFLEEYLDIEGLRIRLIDTAGVRESDDPIEIEGVRRAREKIQSAELILLVIDGSRGMDDDDYAALTDCHEKNTIIVVNKNDLGPSSLPAFPNDLPRVFLSAKTGQGLQELKDEIYHIFLGRREQVSLEDIILTEERHFDILDKCLSSLNRAQNALSENLSPEFIALDLRLSLDSLGEITGESTPEDIINRIFSRFCIGK